MLNHDHPSDERLSALASRDPDESNDVALSAHVTSCDRCGAVVNEIAELRSALSGLPDMRPHRPLQLVPGLERDASDDAASGWVRRLFGPVLATGAALALVGAVGTAAPLLGGMASSGAQVGDTLGGAEPTAAAEAAGEAAATEEPSEAGQGTGSATDRAAATDGTTLSAPGATAADHDESSAALSLEPDRPPWPMLLFAGVALILAALLLRWILDPRAG